ncbi:MAG: hypothetical protein IJQ31_02165 [Thermoguttaceae bacterium]|nr:hypothetical protein [Thermoguttaceae bacterium]
MTSKLRRKLQTTIQRITADPRTLCGRQDVCRLTALLAAVLVAGIAGAADNWVRSDSQNNVPEKGNVPLVRIDTTTSDAEDSKVVQVSYAAPAASSNSGSALKWVAVDAPENSKNQKAEQKNESRVTPIPSVMPRYSRIRLTAGDDSNDELNMDLNGLESLGDPEDDSAELNEDSPMQSLEIPALDPETEEDDEQPLADEDELEAQNPGAIGNEYEESTMKQGGLDLNADALDDQNVEPAKEQLPALEQPGNLPSAKDPISESFTTKQVDDSDFDMPCESSEPMHRITEITNDIELHDNRIVPKSCPLSPEGENFPAREFAGTNFTWTASNLCHNPLYFEQPALERYGHTIGPLQPVLSGAQFLMTIPALPMLMAIDPPNECEYALGFYRPGSCAPRKWSPIPYSTRGALVTGGVATALVFLIP